MSDCGVPVSRLLGDITRYLGVAQTSSLTHAQRHQPVTGISQDSRSVRPGDLYIALPGRTHHGGALAARQRRGRSHYSAQLCPSAAWGVHGSVARSAMMMALWVLGSSKFGNRRPHQNPVSAFSARRAPAIASSQTPSEIAASRGLEGFSG